MKKIVVLASGGDAPGMNAGVRAITRMAEEKGIEVYAAMYGYRGLINNDYKKLTVEDVENIIQLGGATIKSSRCPEFMTKEGFNVATKNIKKNKFEAVIVLGGDGSMRGAKRLAEAGIKTICIPCTIDNDMSYTDFTIGFDTAANTITKLLNNVRDTSASHGRVCVVEVMGRHSGDLALNAGMAAGAEVILVPEVIIEASEVAAKVKLSASRGEKCVIVVVAEGYGTAEEVANSLQQKIDMDVKSMNLGYVQRGGSPTTFDRLLATKLGATAIEKLVQGESGLALGIKNGKVIALKFDEAIAKKHTFDVKAHKLNNILSV